MVSAEFAQPQSWSVVLPREWESLVNQSELIESIEGLVRRLDVSDVLPPNVLGQFHLEPLARFGHPPHHDFQNRLSVNAQRAVESLRRELSVLSISVIQRSYRFLFLEPSTRKFEVVGSPGTANIERFEQAPWLVIHESFRLELSFRNIPPKNWGRSRLG